MGALLARFWTPRYALLPWALTSALLTVAAMWDFWDRRGPIDYILLGLAAYELMLGLLEQPATATPRAAAVRPRGSRSEGPSGGRETD